MDYHGYAETFPERGKRYVYDTLSYDKKVMISEGELLPIYLEEVIPGSIFSVRDSFVLKNIPSPYRAVFDDAYLDEDYYFVPKRLLWGHFEEFIGADATPDAYTDPQEYTEPMLDFETYFKNGDVIEPFSILNCLGLPAGPCADIGAVNLAPLAGIALIWNSFYRDENLQDENPLAEEWKNLASGSTDQPHLTNLDWARIKGSTSRFARVNKYADLFTKLLPKPQKGAEVLLPLGNSAPIRFSQNLNSVILNAGSQSIPANSNLVTNGILAAGGTNGSISADDGSTIYNPVRVTMLGDQASKISADLSSATAASISDLEKAVFAMQYLRALAAGGTRYIELLAYVYGTHPKDETLQRPEFLGTLHKRIGFNQVASTAGAVQQETETSRPTGSLGGYMQASGDQGIFVRQFKEHGYIIGLASIRIRHSYGQGIPRIFLKKNRFDYFNRFFARLGLVPVEKRQLKAGAIGTLGFAESWYENKNHPDEVGAFAGNTIAADLRAYTYADNFQADPTLSSDFVVEQRGNIDQTLIGAESVPQFVLGIHHQVKATTPVPLDSMPRGL